MTYSRSGRSSSACELAFLTQWEGNLRPLIVCALCWAVTPQAWADEPSSEPAPAESANAGVAEPSATDAAPTEPASDAAPVDVAAEEPPPWANGDTATEEAAPSRPADQLQFTFGGQLEYNLRFRPVAYTYGTYFHDVAEPPTLSRNELKARFKVGAKLGRYGMQSDVELALRASPQAKSLGDLSEVKWVTPFFIEAKEAYVYGRDAFGAKGLDFRVGQQLALFGVGDQFNPTNTINPDDFEDVLLFGEQQGNLMVRLDYSPAWNWQITGILIPVFKPALLPDTGYLAQTPDRFPFTDDETRWNLNAEAFTAEALFQTPTVVRDVSIQMPELAAKNMQAFGRVAASLGGQDIALSYYYGFNDTPVPLAQDAYQSTDKICLNDKDPNSACVNGLLQSDVTLGYQRMQTLGLNMSGEFDAFGWLGESVKPIGYRFELGVFFPEEINMAVNMHNIAFPLAPVQDGPHAFKSEPGGNVATSKPFAKWTLGLDYTFNKHLYMNTQWVHGFPDEFGAGDWMSKGSQVRQSSIRQGASPLECIDIASFSGKGETCAEEWLKPKLGDYLVVGLDTILASQALTIRLFTIWDLLGASHSTYDVDAGERTTKHYSMITPEGFSAVIYPELIYKPGSGLEFDAGALLQFGKSYSRFGAPENGGHQIFFRAKYSF